MELDVFYVSSHQTMFHNVPWPMRIPVQRVENSFCTLLRRRGTQM